ncbi:MAG: MBL fold metallo-hydrolase [Gammaproteobacteria bacterium]
MRFASLGSGSRGNGTLIAAGATTVLVDCGFPLRETERRLARLEMAAPDLAAILVTHEHGDHHSGVGMLARRYGIPVWLTPGTRRAGAQELGELPRVNEFSCHAPFAIGDLQVEPLAVPHDAREPSQFVFGDGVRRLGVVTDVGRPTPFLCQRLSGCDALMLEFNHDEAMLANGEYPPQLKKRVGGDQGHLSNRQAADLLARIDRGRMQHFVAAHLSEKNNRPALVRVAAAAVLGCEEAWIGVADQALGLPWREIL